MRITDLQVDGFGVWKGLTVENLSENITVFCGENEAGKTTLMQFVRAMLFGFSEERQEKYIPPVYGGLGGGSIEVYTSQGEYEVQRFVDPNRINDRIGDLAVTDMRDGSVFGRAQLGTLMSDIDESIFSNVFAIGLREIQELGALNSTDAAEHLYKLTSGLDRVSLIDVMRDLQKRREVIWSNDAKAQSRLAELANRRQQLHREIDDLKTRSKRWSRIAAQTTDISNQLTDVLKQLKKLDRESRLIEISMQISDRWQSRRSLIDQIKNFGSLPDKRDIKVVELDLLNEKITQQKERISQIKLQRKSVKKEALSLPVNRQLWAQKAQVEAIAEHSPWVESLERQAARLRGEIDNIENSLVGEVSGLGTQLKIKAKDVKDLGNRGLASLQETSKKVLVERERLKLLKQELDKTGFELGQHEERLSTSFSEGHSSSTLEETSRNVNRLRRRIELEEKINKLTRTRSDLERDIDNIVQEQVLPVGKLSVIGIVFVLGTVFLGFGLVDALSQDSYFGRGATQLGFLLMLMGAVCGFLAMGLKYHWERIAKDELDDFRHQMDIVRQQLKRSKTERDEVERQLPEGAGQWDLELSDAEQRLARMEGLLPLENRLQSTKMNLEELRRRISNQEHEVKSVENLWRSSLRTAGLPESLEPLQLKEITERANRISGFDYRLDQFKAELVERERDLLSLNKRIDRLFQDTGLTASDDRIENRLNQMISALNQQRSLVNNRKELASKYRGYRTQLNKCKRELDRLLGQKNRLLAKVGAEEETEYRQFDIRHQQRQKLIQQRENLSEQISAALGTHFKEKDLIDYLDAYGLSGLENRWETVQSKIESVKEHQTKLIQQRGEFLQEVKMLGEDSRLDEARLELSSIEAEFNQLQKEWQGLAASTQLLETIRESYESKRQPATLKEASQYLERLTDSHYTRIWTRLVGEELLVDNKDGETISVDKLSRGTREAVYLSLRLALIGAYARRGAVLPIVLDDILVNFDAKRAHAAADLLCEFSRNGYQILMFTCHDHMRDMFDSLGADVQVLPHHKDVFQSQSVPTPYEPRSMPQPRAIAPTPQPVLQTVEAPMHAIPAYVAPQSNLDLTTDQYDADLEYELSAVATDQEAERQLRHEMVYVSKHLSAPIDLSGNDDIWQENSVPY